MKTLKVPNREPDFVVRQIGVGLRDSPDTVEIWVDELIERYTEHDWNHEDERTTVEVEINPIRITKDGNLEYFSPTEKKWNNYNDTCYRHINQMFDRWMSDKIMQGVQDDGSSK